MSFALVLLALTATVAAAQTVSSSQPMIPAPACVNLVQNLGYGSRASNVTSLQNFLIAQGDLQVAATGFFGRLTIGAVEKFQVSQGISTTGFVGPLTRAAIERVSCGTTTPPTSAVSIYSITPASGSVGTTVSITGFGFTSSNVLHFGGGAVGNVPITSSIAIACTTNPSCHGGINQTLTFTIPSSVGPYCPPGLMVACPMYMMLVTPGTYNIYVTNDNGTSNTVTFTVTGTSPFPTPTPVPGTVSITGIDAPATLAIGSVGTWTVHASVPSGSTTNLHYSVVWGDQAATPINLMASASSNVQSSATFTHAYSQSGTYTPTFTVTNDSGQSATVSSTLTVTPLY